MSDVVPSPTQSELDEVARASAPGKQPVVLVHGLWLLDSSWDRWAQFFEEAGYVAVTPGWPDDPETVAEARENPDVFAGRAWATSPPTSSRSSRGWTASPRSSATRSAACPR